MVEIIPAILPEDFSDLEEKISLVSAHVPILHVDVTNGTLTPKSNWPYGGDQTDFLKIVNEVEGFPFWEEISFEAHLMVNNPAELIEDWILAGAERIIIHFESFEDDSEVSRVLAILKNRFDKNSSHLGIEVGLGVNMETSMDKIYPHVLEADFIHLMSIKNIGVQGNPFNEQIFDRIRDLKEKYPETIVSVDGGVNLENAPHLIEAGANRLVVGSAIYSAPEPEEALFDLQELSL
jgi:ribulose-phosphate 3-epimerase